MRHSLLLATILLAACGQAPATNQSAATQNGGASAASAQGASANGAESNGLWGVAEEDDAASHRGIDFIVFNRTGRTITGVTIRPDEGPLAPGAAPNQWGRNILTQRELPDGQRAAAHFEADIELCTWQVRAAFADGQTRDFPAVNLCETIRVDLR